MDFKEEIKNLVMQFNKLKDGFKSKGIKFEDETPADQAPEIKFAQLTLADGTVWECEGEMPAVGSAVTVNGEPVADGEYTLEGGQTVTVAEGKIAAMGEATAEPAADYTEQFASIEAKFADFNTQLESVKKAIADMTAAMGKSLEVMEAFAAQTPEPVSKPVNKKDILATEREDRLSKFAQSFKNIKPTA